jgi:methylmalonyl-CoA carboxyltransferase 12S subunit
MQSDDLKSLREELAALGKRVAALEVERGARSAERENRDGASSAPRSALQAPRSTADGLTDELIFVISAAIAAFLGKKPHIRQIRLLGATGWAQQGRVMIQASHALAARHARS